MTTQSQPDAATGPRSDADDAGPDGADSADSSDSSDGADGAGGENRLRRPRVPTDVVALSVHGPDGVLDLLVPEAATVGDVAAEYAAHAPTSRTVHRLADRLGRPLDADVRLEDAGVVSGTVLVAIATDGTGAAQARDRSSSATDPAALEGSPASAAWFTGVALLAALAAWATATLADGVERDVATGLLGGAGLLGCLPVGRWARHRAVAAPALVGAAAFVIAWNPAPERLPTVLGVAALAAAVTAAVARALGDTGDEPLRVWIVTGSLCFVVSAGAALLDLAPQVVFAVLLTLAMLAARFVPAVAVEVPDQYLIDLERLAVTAWSARERPTGRRGRIVVPRTAVATVAARGTRTVTASAVAVLVVTVVCAPLLLLSADLPIDRIGARCLVGFAGCALLLAARSFRHVAARAFLRTAGLVCLWAVAVVLLASFDDLGRGWVAAGAAGLGALLVVVAVALGRGWRSAWWSRRAEVAEGLTGAFALGSVVVAVGLFRHLWQLTS